MMSVYFRGRSTHESIRHFTDSVNVTLRGDDMQGFDTKWDKVFLSIEEAPQVHIPESMYTEDTGFRTVGDRIIPK